MHDGPTEIPRPTTGVPLFVTTTVTPLSLRVADEVDSEDGPREDVWRQVRPSRGPDVVNQNYCPVGTGGSVRGDGRCRSLGSCENRPGSLDSVFTPTVLVGTSTDIVLRRTSCTPVVPGCEWRVGSGCP